MSFLTSLSNVARSEGDPKVLATGPSSLGGADRLARALGWFSIGLGLAELLAPRLLTRAMGVEGNETLLRAYGAREIAAGMLSLSPDKGAGLQARVAGDALDGATLLALRPKSAKPGILGLALAAVLGVTLLDIVGAAWVKADESRKKGEQRSYKERSGYPRGLARARGAARDFLTPPDMRAAPTGAGARSRARL
jgi:hypothetical protein